MITARKFPIFEKVFDLYNTSLLRKHFHRIMIRGTGGDAPLDRSMPIILFANHSNWWDGLVAFHLSREVFHVDAYAMMEERQLERYRFFRWVGAFSVDRGHPRSALTSLAYAERLLDRPGRAVWVFPQGVMQPNDARPLRFYSGIGRLAVQLGKVQLVPLAFRYEFMMEQRPECFVSTGEPLIIDRVEDVRLLVRELESRLTVLLDELRADVVASRTEGFTRVLSGKLSTNAAYDRVRVRRTGR